MQNKGFVKAIAVLLTLICIFYLSFSFVTSHYTNKAAKMGTLAGANTLIQLKTKRCGLARTRSNSARRCKSASASTLKAE